MRSPFARVLAPSVLALSLFCIGGLAAQAQQMRIPLPKKSKYTPVQQLNRDGVAALNKHDLSKAKRLFYKAYLIDPNDPFTLNNLGYISELQGQVDRAQRFYALAGQQATDAVIARASSPLPTSSTGPERKSRNIGRKRMPFSAVPQCGG